jgi:hypothetical protein
VKRTKKPSTTHEFLDAFADVVADRVARKVVEASGPPPMPEKVPLWLHAPRLPRGKRRPRPEGKWTIDGALRDAGLLKYGDPGYDDALKRHLECKRRRDAELHAGAQLRKAVRLLDTLLTGVARSRASV